MEKAIVLGSKDKTINTKIFREVLYEESDNIQYNKESWYRIKQKIRENNIDTVMGSKDNICLLYTSPSPRDRPVPRLPSSA